MKRKRGSALLRGAGLLALALCLATTVGAEGELGMAVTNVSRKAGVLGGHPSHEAEISATGQGGSVRVWLAKTMSREYLYDFSYTGIGDGFERHHGELEAILRSLVLQ